MSIRIWALLYGVIFLAMGGLSYLPFFNPNGQFLGMFTVSPVNSILYIITGVMGLLWAFSAYSARQYFKVVGIFYLFLTLLTFMMVNNLLIVRFQHSDNLFHLVASLFALYLGFGKPRGEATVSSKQPPVYVEAQSGTSNHERQREQRTTDIETVNQRKEEVENEQRATGNIEDINERRARHLESDETSQSTVDNLKQNEHTERKYKL